MLQVDIPRRERPTKRLMLRPTSSTDADRAVEIRSDWDVSRMLRAALFPPDLEDARRWFEEHEREWLEGKAYRFAIEVKGRMIGVIDVDGVQRGEGQLGYWLERAAWGQGYATEAAEAVIGFAFRDVGMVRLRAGHAIDNPASGKVLAKLGFNPVDIVEHFSRSRGENVRSCRYLLVDRAA
jgi:RimJ/RimL family protein N-acetyltransferase